MEILRKHSGDCIHLHGTPNLAGALTDFEALLSEVRACRVCEATLPLGPRPLLQMAPTARILIASQAPGSKAHASGIPFSDRSGDRLREWMGISLAGFYDAASVAIVPMGLCYPGRGQSGDAPPRPECAPLWRDRLLTTMPDIRFDPAGRKLRAELSAGPGALTERVREFTAYLPDHFPLPHPSWRVTGWSRKNPWFEADVLPALRATIRRALAA